ncbi:MAG: ATP-binding protein [Holosporaceae bacterium]|jgi:predicted AAA+ superfamily ATPase|nr:ATP-binding protein [Holosporaceae bacterium]
MKRKVLQELINWKNNPDKMPLIIEGARQVGKTWLIKEFGAKYYQNTVYFNFDDNRKLHKLFKQDLNPDRLISEFELLSGSKITPHDTLIIFDEIQECNRALVSLKYFCETAPQYHIVSAGSLLGVAIYRENSFPVGKVNTIQLYPMTFAEFLEATGETRYQSILEKQAYNSAYVLEDELIGHLKYYYFVGGMPKAVHAFASKHNLEEIRSIQKDILSNYERDFSKHIDAPSIPKVGQIWTSIPNQLARENKQFVYREIKEGARASQYESAIYWLSKVGLIYAVHKIETPNLPLSAYKKEAFKLYMLDVGLLSTLVDLTIQNLTNPDPEVFNHFKGSLTEQFVLQELKAACCGKEIFYWMNDRKKGVAEVDFLLQYNGEIIPIEAKASVNLKAKSLRVYIDYHNPRVAIRTSLSRYGRNKNLYDIPLYLLGEFINIVKKK